MQKVLTAEEMREVDRLTSEDYGIPSLLLMENAAHAAARLILEKLGGRVAGKSVSVLCGKGNNGGDGAALARILWTLGAEVHVYLFGKIKDSKGDARINFEILDKLKNQIDFSEVDDPMSLFETNLNHNSDVIVDALFGTGLDKPIAGELKDFVQAMVALQGLRDDVLFVSLDLPSGLNSNRNVPNGVNFRADLTVTFTAPKLANVLPPASNFNGELRVANIGSPRELINSSPSKLYVADSVDARDWLNLTRIQNDSYKKSRGAALIIAGSENYSGAAVLSANACFAAGAGVVTVVVPNSVKEIVAGKTSPEIIVKTLETTEVLGGQVDVTAIGCGLANNSETHKFISETIENRIAPMVLDAEALNALAPLGLRGSNDLPLILTPHLGEFKRLLGRGIGENRIEEARVFSIKHNVILVLKGERTLIASPDGRVVINPTGNAGVSRAGAGDTLTGIIASFLAQSFAVGETNLESAFLAVVSALYVAGTAGEIASSKFGERLLMATDVRDSLNEAICEIERI